MQTFLGWVYWAEDALLRWARVIVVSGLGVLLGIGVLMLLTNGVRLSAWPGVTPDDDIAYIRFSAEPASSQGGFRYTPFRLDPDRYQAEVEEMAESLTALVVSVGLSFDAESKDNPMEKYLNDIIARLLEVIREHHYRGGRELEDRLDDAVENMVDYVEDMVDHYTDALEAEEDGITRRLRKLILDGPGLVQPYVEAFAHASSELRDQAAAEQRRVADTRAKGLVGLWWMLLVIGIPFVSALPLLVVLRADALLREKLGDS